MALVPALIGDDQTELTRANSALAFSLQRSTIVGPVPAGVLIGALGNTNVLFLDAASFFLTVALLGLGVTYRPIAERAASSPTWPQDLGAGLRFVAGTPVIRTVMLVGMLATLGFSVFVQAVLPVFVRDVLQSGPNELGMILGVWGVGFVAGLSIHGALAARWPWRRGETLRNLGFGMVLPLWLLPFFPSLGTAVLALLLAALFTGPIVVSVQTLMQTETSARAAGPSLLGDKRALDDRNASRTGDRRADSGGRVHDRLAGSGLAITGARRCVARDAVCIGGR